MKISLLITLLLLPCLAYPDAEEQKLKIKAESQAWAFKWSVKKEKHKKGFKKKGNMDAIEHVSFLEEQAVLPRTFTLQSALAQVEDQGDCGSCWDFSLTGTLRDTLISVRKIDPGRLSFMYLLNCATTMWGCDGGDFSAASYLREPKGAPGWDQEPYSPRQGTCKQFPPVASNLSYKMLGGRNGPSFKDIAYVLALRQRPLAIDVAADNAWMYYDSGLYNGCTADESGIDHMIELVGYDCEGPCTFNRSGNLPKGKGVYIVKNSWGKDWGEQGYMRTKAFGKNGKRCNAVGADALFYEITPPKPIVADPLPRNIPIWVIISLLFVMPVIIILLLFVKTHKTE